MKFLTTVIMAIPVLPAVGGWLTNRGNATSKVCSLADVSHNAEDKILPMLSRPPKAHGPVVAIRDRNGKIIGYLDKLP